MRRGTKLHKAQARRKDFRLWLTKVGPGEHDRNISRSLRDAAVHHGRRPAGCDFAPAGQGSQSMGLARLTELARRLGMIRSGRSLVRIKGYEAAQDAATAGDCVHYGSLAGQRILMRQNETEGTALIHYV